MTNIKMTELAKLFRQAGYELHLVGGAVRDMIMGKLPHDYDFATDATPDQMKVLFPSAIATGEKHGTLTIPYENEMVEVTTYRLDGNYSDGRRPDSILFAKTLMEDLSRRDFTMNAIAFNPLTGSYYDPFGGVKDIENKILKAVGNPVARFTEDGLRQLRAFRFMAQLRFTAESKLIAALSNEKVHNMLLRVSQERIRDEISKMLIGNYADLAIEQMRLSGTLKIVLHPVAMMDGMEQSSPHIHNVYQHTLEALHMISSDNLATFETRLAMLFHDTGKPWVRSYDKERKRYTFYNHEEKSEQLCFDWMIFYKFSNAQIKAVVELVRNHMEPFCFHKHITDAAVRRFIIRIGGYENLDQLLLLHKYDRLATDENPFVDETISFIAQKCKSVLDKKPPLKTRDLAVNGFDLIQLGYKQGEYLGKMINELMEMVIEDPSLNDKEVLLNHAKTGLGF